MCFPFVGGDPLSIRTLQLPQSEMIPQRLQTTGISGILVNVFFKPPDPAFRWSLKIPANWTLFSGVPSSELVLDMLSVEPTPTLQENQSHTFLVLQVGK